MDSLKDMALAAYAERQAAIEKERAEGIAALIERVAARFSLLFGLYPQRVEADNPFTARIHHDGMVFEYNSTHNGLYLVGACPRCGVEVNYDNVIGYHNPLITLGEALTDFKPEAHDCVALAQSPQPPAEVDPCMPTDEEWREHPWAKWSAVDADGRVYLYGSTLYKDHWGTHAEQLQTILPDGSFGDWRESSRKRPAHL